MGMQTLVRSKLLQSALSRLGCAIERLPRPLFSLRGQILIDATVSTVAIWLAYQLRFDFEIPSSQRAILWTWAVLLVFLRPLCLMGMAVYRGTWRYFNFKDAVSFSIGALPVTGLMFLMRVGSAKVFGIKVPLIVIVVDYTIFLLLAFGVRGLRRLLYETSLRDGNLKRTLLVGTEEGLASGLRQIDLHPEVTVTGLLTPDPKLLGSRINGFTVVGTPDELDRHLTAGHIDLVLVADSGVDSIGKTVSVCMEFGVEFRLLPSASKIISGEVRVSTSPTPELALSNAKVTDVAPHPLVVDAFHGRTVLITGAGGSIGSELSRQVSRLPVSRVLLLDQDENAMFYIHGELAKCKPNAAVVPLVADIRDRDRLRAIFSKYRPQVILHAAAYKHVPVMEHNCSEAVLNNVVGTRTVAEMAVEFEAERFLMISTDKAVNPSSMMGATKRMAELLVQDIARRTNGHAHHTRCTCVRFGNVAGSSGSVIPIFLKQIAHGGPITITNDEMTRYFMTIPEAVQLVLEAASIGGNGEICMLDMGDALKITDLAKRLIRMSGLRPGIDIEIRITGSRPGEKLHEMLWSDASQVIPTSFPRILSVQPPPPHPHFADHLRTLELAALTHNDEHTRESLMGMPIEFAVTPSPAALDQPWHLDRSVENSSRDIDSRASSVAQA